MTTLHVTNAKIWTGDPARPFATTLTIEDGRVTAIDAPHAGEPILDCKGDFVTPGLIDAQVWPPLTSTGTLLLVPVPSPSWPGPPYPQQYPAPAVVTPQLKRSPALTDAQVWPPLTNTGTVLFVLVPLPN